jgi:hypothetical protein
MSNLRIVPATEPDIPVILDLIHALAEYEKLAYVVIYLPICVLNAAFCSLSEWRVIHSEPR